MVLDYFDSPVAYNPDSDDLVTGATFQVFAVDDSSYATPLALTDPASGANIPVLSSSNIGVLPSFRVAGDLAQVVLKSGAFTTLLTSRYGVLVEAGFDADQIEQAIAAVPLTQAARDAAIAAQEAAEVAADVIGAVGGLATQDDLDNIGVEVAAITADPTDAVTSLWIDASDFYAVNGTPAWVATGNLRVGYWEFPDVSTNRLAKLLRDIPSHWATMYVDFVWSNVVANAGNVVWLCETHQFSPGESWDATPVSGSGSVVAVADTTTRLAKVSASSAAITVDPAKFVLLRVSRNGGSGSDTLTSAAALLGIQLRKAS